ncbi:MAG TPA: hypothetical protein ENN80_07425 [Candidatus Hydrogenedentes bacterium]|nr:hypothetical protein [Candidatus Hydrogenedentota bacterium]
MKRYNFSTFEVDDANRQAHDVCRAVADLDPVSPQPVTLVGDNGSGKTHLLYAVVNRVRAASAKTGLAYVTAHDFPEQVSGLIKDPSPLKRAESAVLLADQLDEFVEHAEELDVLVQLFLDHGHSVLMASNVHPKRLTNLPASLREAINDGQVIEVQARRGSVQPAEEEGLVRAQQEEIARLKDQLTQVQSAGEGREASELRKELDVVRAEKEGLRTELEELQERTQALAQEVEQYRVELDRAVEEKTSAEGELGRLQDELEALQAGGKAEASAAEELADARERIAVLEAERARLHEALDASHNEGAAAQQEANVLVQRAEALLEQIETNRARFAQSEEEHGEQVRQLEAQMEQERVSLSEALETARAEAAAAQESVAELRQAFAQQREALERELALARNEARSAQEARDSALAKLHVSITDDAARAGTQGDDAALEEGSGGRDALEIEMGRLREDLDAQAVAMERLRVEADGARNQADWIEGQLNEVYAQFDLLRQTSQVVGGGLKDVQRQLAEAAGALEKLADRLGNAADVGMLDENGKRAFAAEADTTPSSDFPELPDPGVKFPRPEI